MPSNRVPLAVTTDEAVHAVNGRREFAADEVVAALLLVGDPAEQIGEVDTDRLGERGSMLVGDSAAAFPR